ncbi:cysteine desulfurase [Candidatus Gottesmanbacteria bacterium]|nr:cysteine desulfurase [Candidatus Gottesmanbacteria bacterium]
MLDSLRIRNDFPFLQRKINGKPIIYLDSTATSLKPQSVLDKMDEYYTQYTANVFRGIYSASEKATEEFEGARKKVARFIAATASEIIFTRNTTESINLVAYSWGRLNISEGDEIVTTIMEHHSNFVPWQQLVSENGSILKIWNTGPNYQFNTKDLDKLITRRTKLLTITAVSNVLGTINDIAEITQAAKRMNKNCLVLVDAAQAVPHMPVDVQAWGADFVAFSSHKMLGPTGVGVLWGKKSVLEAMAPFNYGGEMISEVHEDKTIFKEPPHKFEAGTPDIGGVIGFGAAIDYLSALGMHEVRVHEKEITTYALKRLSDLKGIKVIGPKNSEDQGGVISFTLKGIHPHDIAQVLDEDNVCIRVGFHCAQPLHEYLDCGPTARASFYVYTTKEDVDALIMGLSKVQKMFT